MFGLAIIRIASELLPIIRELIAACERGDEKEMQKQYLRLQSVARARLMKARRGG